MTLASELDLPFIDPGDPDYQSDPYRAYREALRDSWLVRVPEGFGVLTYDDADQLLRHPDVAVYFAFPSTYSEFLHTRAQEFILSMVGEEHARVRRLAYAAFKPREIQRWRPHVRKTIGDLIDAVQDAGECDFARQIAEPYPVHVTAPVLGIPLEESLRLAPLSDDWITIFDFPNQAQNAARVEHAWKELEAALDEVVMRRRRDPGDDLVTKLIEAEDAGDRLSHEELVMLLVALYVAGIDTTRHQMTLGLLTFVEHQDQWRRLAENPELAPRAVEEVLRYSSTIHTVGRIALKDIEYRGVTFPEGSTILAFIRSANRDSTAFPDADRFDITRRAEHLSFAAGPHFCLGAPLARVELAEAFSMLAQRWPRVELAAEPSYFSVTGNYGASHLPVRFATHALT